MAREYYSSVHSVDRNVGRLMNVLNELKNELITRGASISVAESLTGGLVQNAIVELSGSSSFFEGGITAYSLDQKHKFLGIEYTHAQSVNCVSSIVAEEMAKGVCDMFGTNVGISTTGYSEPMLDKGVNYPFAYVAVCIYGVLSVKKIDAVGMPRNEARAFICNKAIEFCLEQLKKSE